MAAPAPILATPAAFSFTGPLAIASGVLGVASAIYRNRQIEQFVKEAGESINQTITSVRVRTIDDIIRLSSEARQNYGTAAVALRGGTGISVSEVLASIAADVAEDSYVLKRNRDQAITELEAQKRIIAEQYGAQMQSPLLAGLSSGIAGFETGLSLDNALADFSHLKAMSRFQSEIDAGQDRLGVLDRIGSAMQLGYWTEMAGLASARRRAAEAELNRMQGGNQ